MNRFIATLLFTISCLYSYAQTPGTALAFDGTNSGGGSNDYVAVPHNASLNLGNTYTIEAWVYVTDNVNNTIVDKGDYRYLFQTHPNGQSGLGLYNPSMGWKYSFGVVPTNTWVHVAVTFDLPNNAVKFYMNGSLLSTHSGISSPGSDNGMMSIGMQSPFTCACNFFDGKMDELRIWNRVLGQCEIINNMSCEINPSIQTGLRAYYRFNNGYANATNPSFTTVADISGNGNNGTLTNFALTGTSSNWTNGTVSGSCTGFTYPAASFTAAPGANSCASNNITYTTQSGMSNYTWTVPGTFGVDYIITAGGLGTGNNTVTLQWLTAGTKNVTVTYTTAGCIATPAANTTTVSSLPTITGQPSNLAMCTSNNATLSVTATGANSYMWQVDAGGSNWNNMVASTIFANVNTSTMGINKPGTGYNGYRYRCVVMNNGCPVFSNASVLTISTPANIVTDPSGKSVCVGGTTSFSVVAAGTSFSYQWQASTGTGFFNLVNGGMYSNVNTAILGVSGPTIANDGTTYRCALIDNACGGNAVSTYARLTVNAAPALTVAADTITGCPGNTIIFSTSAVGNGLSYQWQVDDGTGFADIIDTTVYVGMQTHNLYVYKASTGMNAYLYRCIVGGTCTPAAVTNLYKLNILASPSITSQPVSTSRYVTDTAFFEISANGAGLSYQWQENRGNGFVNLSDAGLYKGTKTTKLIIKPLTFNMNTYLYRCIVSGACSPIATSKVDTLTVKKSFNTAVNGSGIVKENQLVVFPNPINSGSLNIRIDNPTMGNIAIKVIDKLGRVVYNNLVELPYLVNGVSTVVDVNNLVPGIYTIQVVNGKDGKTSTAQFVKE